ncbi:unnamed protein product [Caenorhabditis nigoni]
MKLLILLLPSLFPTVDGCLRILGNTACACKFLQLDSRNIKENEVKNNALYDLVSSSDIRYPQAIVEDCFVHARCAADGYELYIFDTDKGAKIGDYSLDGFCDPSQQKWQVDTGNGIEQYKMLKAVCVLKGTENRCSPTGPSSILFAYSNDLDYVDVEYAYTRHQQMTFPPNPEDSSDEIHKIAFLPSENDENLPEFQLETPENLGEWSWRFQRNLKYVDDDFELFDDDGNVITWTELTDQKKGKILKNEKSPEMLYKKATPTIPNILKNSRSQNSKFQNLKYKLWTSGDRREIQNRTPKMYPVRVLDQENSRSQNQNLNPADHMRTLQQRNSGNSGNSGNLQYPGKSGTTGHRTLQSTQNQNQNRNPSNPAPRRQNQQPKLWFPQKTKYPVRVLAQGNQPDPPKYYFPETGTSEKLEKPYFRCTPFRSPPNSDSKTNKKVQ